MAIPEIISVVPEDIKANIAFRITDLKKLKTGLEITTFSTSNQEQKESADYISNILYPFLENFLKDF